ncbi:hypothetical protein LTR17_001012 [Elasticomyces elasticus]|nr:hypothetical protein LTR17_001012 [Elasticomyces elasticus]
MRSGGRPPSSTIEQSNYVGRREMFTKTVKVTQPAIGILLRPQRRSIKTPPPPISSNAAVEAGRGNGLEGTEDMLVSLAREAAAALTTLKAGDDGSNPANLASLERWIDCIEGITDMAEE